MLLAKQLSFGNPRHHFVCFGVFVFVVVSWIEGLTWRRTKRRSHSDFSRFCIEDYRMWPCIYYLRSGLCVKAMLDCERSLNGSTWKRHGEARLPRVVVRKGPAWERRTERAEGASVGSELGNGTSALYEQMATTFSKFQFYLDKSSF